MSFPEPEPREKYFAPMTEIVKFSQGADLDTPMSDFAKGFAAGRESVMRKNNSGCVCIIDDGGNVISACDAHLEWFEKNAGSEPTEPMDLLESGDLYYQTNDEIRRLGTR